MTGPWRHAHTADQATARTRLFVRLRDDSEAGRAVPCFGPDRHRWTSDDFSDLAQAVKACHGCPALALCAAAGTGERWGVWGGRAVGIRPTPRPGTLGFGLLAALVAAPAPLTRVQTAADAREWCRVEAARVGSALTALHAAGLTARTPTGHYYATTAGHAAVLGEGALESRNAAAPDSTRRSGVPPRRFTRTKFTTDRTQQTTEGTKC